MSFGLRKSMNDHDHDRETGAPLYFEQRTSSHPPPPEKEIGGCLHVEEMEEDEYVEDYDDDYDDGDYDDAYDDDADQDSRNSELACPYCTEDFDILGLCCHIDGAHHVDTKSGICPVCVTKVGMNMATHVISQHENILKALCKKKLRRGGSRTTLSLLMKELQDKQLHSLLKGMSAVDSSLSTRPDPLLMSFVYNTRPASSSESRKGSSSAEERSAEKHSDNETFESSIQASPTMGKDQDEMEQRCEFVRGLLFSTILDDNL